MEIDVSIIPAAEVHLSLSSSVHSVDGKTKTVFPLSLWTPFVTSPAANSVGSTAVRMLAAIFAFSFSLEVGLDNFGFKLGVEFFVRPVFTDGK